MRPRDRFLPGDLRFTSVFASHKHWACLAVSKVPLIAAETGTVTHTFDLAVYRGRVDLVERIFPYEFNFNARS